MNYGFLIVVGGILLLAVIVYLDNYKDGKRVRNNRKEK